MKNLMLTTTLVAASAFAAHAQTAAPQFRAEAMAGEFYASNFIGMRVYTTDVAYSGNMANGVQKDWNDVGEINDIVLNRDGSVDAVLVDVGGFLGMGERQVAMDMKSIKMVNDDSTANDPEDFFLVVNSTKAALEAAPEYKRREMAAPMAADSAATAVPMAAGTTAADPAAVQPMATDATKPAATMSDKDKYAEVDTGTITTEALTGARVYDATDADIGEVSELVLAADGKVDQAVVDVGGFLGMGEKPVAMKMSDLKIMKEKDGDTLRVYVTQTKEQLEAMPDYVKK